MTGRGEGLREVEVGQVFTGFAVVRRRELRTRRDGAPFLVVEFGDRSGRLSGNIWDDAERLFGELPEGTVVKLQGRIELYRDKRQLAVKRLRPAKVDDGVDPADLIPAADIDPEAVFHRLQHIVASLGDTNLRELLESFMEDPDFASRFKRAPAGKLWHHNRLGGLLQHTLSITRLCRHLGRFYRGVDRDLLTAGAILHDIGKVEEYGYATHIDFTDRGRLVGHIVLGAQWVAERAGRIADFPPDLLDRLLHLILSHQGDQFSHVRPMTREAFLLHYADEIDARMDALARIEAELPPGEKWRFVRLLDRHLMFSEQEEAADEGEPEG